MGNLCSSGAEPGPADKVKEKLKAVSSKSSSGNSKEGAAVTPKKEGTYKAMRLLGRGTAADTWLFKDVKLRSPVAIKMFTRPIEGYPLASIKREITLQTELGPGHVNLINVYTLFLTSECLGLVMECAEGGSFIDYVGAKAERHGKGLVLTEDEALYFFKQFISAVAYCHRHKVAHRDLKLDNTLMDKSSPPILKICDFGFAKHFETPLERSESHLGTPEYMSPELLHRNESGGHEMYDARSADVWASGILLLVCLCGAFPYDSQDYPTSRDAEYQLWLEEIQGDWKQSRHLAHNVSALSPEVTDLLDKIFVIDPKERITVDGIMDHPWYQRDLSSKYRRALEKIHNTQESLEAHVSKQRYNKDKIKKRSQDIAALIEKAGKAHNHGRRGSVELQPDQVADFGESLKLVTLAEREIVDEPSLEQQSVVRERFDRPSVEKAVEAAFSGDSRNNGLHEAAQQSRDSRGEMIGNAPIGGGVAG